MVEILLGDHILSDSVDLGLFIRNGAVGQILFTQLGTERNIRCCKVSRRHRKGIDRPGTRVLRVREGRGRRGKQRCVGRRQRRAPRQRALRFLGRGNRERRQRLQLRLDRSDVHAGTDNEHALRLRLQLVQTRQHARQLRNAVARNQLLVNVADGAVRGVDDGQRRGVWLEKQ